MLPWSEYVHAAIGDFGPCAASATTDASVGTSGTSGLINTASARITRCRLSALSAPSASPTPTTPAERVASTRLFVSPLMNTSAHGHTPSALAKRDVYRNVSQRLRSNRSSLTR